jgi:formate hydrogenlyase subunit 6/NADH:ubiquinone oxidoreductase subunit I
VCPTDAVTLAAGHVQLDLGRCLFCTECTSACPSGAIEFTGEYRLSARARGDLVFNGQ